MTIYCRRDGGYDELLIWTLVPYTKFRAVADAAVYDENLEISYYWPRGAEAIQTKTLEHALSMLLTQEVR